MPHIGSLPYSNRYPGLALQHSAFLAQCAFTYISGPELVSPRTTCWWFAQWSALYWTLTAISERISAAIYGELVIISYLYWLLLLPDMTRVYWKALHDPCYNFLDVHLLVSRKFLSSASRLDISWYQYEMLVKLPIFHVGLQTSTALEASQNVLYNLCWTTDISIFRRGGLCTLLCYSFRPFSAYKSTCSRTSSDLAVSSRTAMYRSIVHAGICSYST